MTEDEIQERDEQAQDAMISDSHESIETVAPESEIDHEDDDSEVDSQVDIEAEISVSSKERYEYKYLFNQVRLQVHCFTEYSLTTDCKLQDADKQEIKPSSELLDIIKYLNQHAATEPIRTVASFYGNYDELADIAEIEAYAQERLYRLKHKSEVEMTKELQDETPKQIELPDPATLAEDKPDKQRETLEDLLAIDASTLSPVKRDHLEHRILGLCKNWHEYKSLRGGA
jgi:hypothetical protein